VESIAVVNAVFRLSISISILEIGLLSKSKVVRKRANCRC